ncbi:MAG: right-handed parallel beta-helix repeat-containing protein, partial [Actinomycetota bacterium]|nr:right-handed parallel beta-helix repeat-containing protein [Actinomycetota bacterium]
SNVGSGLTDFGDGIAIFDSSGNVVSGNRVVDNGPFSGISVLGAGSTGNTIDSNFLAGNDAVDVTDPHHGDPTGTQQTDGVRLEPGTSSNVVTGNVVRGSGLDGIALFFNSTDNVVRGNDVRGNGFHDKTHRKGSGIILFNRADRNLVEANTVIGNAANGIVLRGPLVRPAPLPPIPGAQFNQVLNNTTRGNAVLHDPETEFYDLRDDNFDPPCDQNVWRGNTFRTFNQPCVTQ